MIPTDQRPGGTDTSFALYPGLEASKDVGIAQAEALKGADIKIVTTASDAASGLSLVSLGTGLRAVVDAFQQEGKK